MELKCNFYVSPLALSGCDDHDGTDPYRPFATLERAQRAVRDFIQTSSTTTTTTTTFTRATKEVVVGLMPGTHVIQDTLVVSKDDCGGLTEGGHQWRVCWVGLCSPSSNSADDGLDNDVILTSAHRLTGWTEVDVDGAEIEGPLMSGLRIWSVPFPSVMRRLYRGDNTTALPRACGPGFVPPVRHSTWKGSCPRDRQILTLPEDVQCEGEHVELEILPTCDWTRYVLSVESYDPISRDLTVQYPGKYALGAQKKAALWRNVPTAWLANSESGMQRAGNWMVRNGRVFLATSSSIADENASGPDHVFGGVWCPTLVEMVIVDDGVQNFHLENLTFAMGDRHVVTGEDDEDNHCCKSSAVVSFRDTVGCSIRRCRFRDLGSDGVGIVRGESLVVEDCSFKRLGASAIVVSSSRSVGVRQNVIENTGEDYAGSPAVNVWQCQQVHVQHNRIQHVPGNAVRVSGRFQKDDDAIFVEANEITEVATFLGDSNAVYVTQSGTNVVRNYVHDLTNRRASAAFRTDGVGTTSRVSFRNNVVHRVARGGLVLKGSGHTVDENIWIDCVAHGTGFEGDGAGWIDLRCGPSDGTRILRNIFVSNTTESSLFLNARSELPERFHNRNRDLSVDLAQVEQSGNVCGGHSDEKNKSKSVEHVTAQGFQIREDEAVTTAISVVEGRVVLDPDSNLFKCQGYNLIDMNAIGITQEGGISA